MVKKETLTGYNTVAVANAALTTAQIQLAGDGETIEIKVEVTDISGSVPTQDKEAMEDTLEAYYGEIPGITLGMYIDISVFIRVGEGDWNAIRKTGECALLHDTDEEKEIER